MDRAVNYALFLFREMRSLVLILVMVYKISISNPEITRGKEVNPTHPTGIYYEHLLDLRFIHHHRRLVIIIDARTPHARLRAYKQHVQEMTSHVEKMDADVTMIDELKYQLNEKFKQARKYF